MAYLNNDSESERVIATYPRYWHGHLIFIKPFFVFFDFGDSRIFHLGFQLILFVIALYWFKKRGLKSYILPLTLLLILWNPATVGMCMQYYACFYISFSAMIVFLWKREYLLKDCFYCHLFFMIVGICTSYFDFLTYPIVTLGLPLTIWLLTTKKEKNSLIQLMLNVVFWGIGYLGMWLEKWIISSWILKENIVLDAIENVLSRTSTSVDGESISRFKTIIYLAETLVKWPYVIIFGIAFGYVIIMGLKQGSFKDLLSARKYRILGMFLLIAMLPCVWFFVTANHSYVHPRLVYRSWGVSLFAVFSGIIYFFKKQE